MPKKRKTLQNKILADQKRQMIHKTESSVISSSQTTVEQNQTKPGVTFSLPTSQGAVQKAVKPQHEAITITTGEYGYLTNDLMRTALLTGAIVLTELLVKILFRG
jgi:hypothetical protein